MNLKQAHAKAAIREAKKEAVKQMTEIINKGLALQMELVVCLVLHDKFGFGAQRCAKAIMAFEEMWGDVTDQRLSLDDIEETVKNEIGLVVKDDELELPRSKKSSH